MKASNRLSKEIDHRSNEKASLSSAKTSLTTSFGDIVKIPYQIGPPVKSSEKGQIAENCHKAYDTPLPAIVNNNTEDCEQISAHVANGTLNGKPDILSHSSVEKPRKTFDKVDEKYGRLVCESEKLRVDLDSCREQLRIQSQVNDELKKLLVATMGNDLEVKLECLTRDKVRLAEDVVKYTAELCNENEQLERVSIQSDVWRSKFLAASVMIEELVGWRHFLIRQFTEAQLCVRNLLREREHFAKTLYDSFVLLNDLHNSMKAKEPRSYDHLLLRHSIQDLCESLRDISQCIYSTLPSIVPNLPSNPTVCKSPSIQQTKAESDAVKILKTDAGLFYSSDPCEEFQKLTDKKALIFGHSTQCNFKNLTVNCCKKCAGEMKLV